MDPNLGWEWCHSPLPAREQGVPGGLRGGGEGVWLPRDLHQIHGILQSEDVGRVCFWVGDAVQWLKEGPFVQGWFDLYDLYEKWASAPRGSHDNGRRGCKHTEEYKEKQSILRLGKPSPRKGVPNSPEQ